MKVFVLNAGSSSHKCAIFENHEKEPVWTGFLDWNRSEMEVFIKYGFKNGESFEKTIPKKSKKEVLKDLILTAKSLEGLKAVGHRVVHGGSVFQDPVIIIPVVKETIHDLIKLAPLHNPANLEGIDIMEELFPEITQIAVFDTAFHSQIPDVTSTYPIPYSFKENGIKRYGFHGISHEYCMNKALEMLPQNKLQQKIITCHLGNGSSLAAILGGHSIDTTMGFTPMEGLMMGTRCGSIDPGILLYLLREKKMNLEELDHCLNYESGLKGISGGISDMRGIITKMDAKDAESALSFNMFIHSLKGNICKMAASLQGLDILVFTAGIGENSPKVRLECCEGLQFLGVSLDHEKNASCSGDEEISTPESKIRVLVIKTKEEWAIAEKCLSLL